MVTNLRRLMSSPVDRVGVVYRAPLPLLRRRQAALARRGQDPRRRAIRQPGTERRRAQVRPPRDQTALRCCLGVERRQTALRAAHRRRLATRASATAPYKPAIVGAASLVSAVQSFGTFAVCPTILRSACKPPTASTTWLTPTSADRTRRESTSSLHHHHDRSRASARTFRPARRRSNRSTTS